MDAVLVDATCSGTRTLRRNPDIKWRSIDLPMLVELQAHNLEAAESLVKPGGRLVYGTTDRNPVLLTVVPPVAETTTLDIPVSVPREEALPGLTRTVGRWDKARRDARSFSLTGSPRAWTRYAPSTLSRFPRISGDFQPSFVRLLPQRVTPVLPGCTCDCLPRST